MKNGLMIFGGLVAVFFVWLFVASASYKPETFSDVKRRCESNYSLSANVADCEFRSAIDAAKNR